MKDEYKRKRSESAIAYWDKHRKPRLQANGYMTIMIANKRRYVHRVVMESYLGRKLESDEHIQHINGDKTDNRIENLEILSKREHERRHAAERGFKGQKGKEPINKTDTNTIRLIQELRSEGRLIREICKITGLSNVTVIKYTKGA